MEDPALTPSSDDANPSPQIQQNPEGKDNLAIIEMKGGTAIKTIVGNVIYNYYYREDVKIPIDDTAASTEADSLPCPYRGLYHFGPGDAEYFFGRESFVEELVRATQTRNFIPLLGASGSGKSSVVFAGLVPKLQQAGHWQFTHFRPGADPFHALALALVPLYTTNLDETERIRQARNLAGYFRTGEVLLADVFAQIQQNFPTDRVLLIADQFEELYTLCTDETTRRNFLDRLLAGITTPADRIPSAPVLVATMRADFLGNALSYRPFADMLQNADLKLGSMSKAELTEAIEQPAQKLRVTFEAGLVERILTDVEGEPGILPLLEFALTELWRRRSGKQLTHAAYEEIGEVQGALGRHADREYEKFKDEADRERVRRIFVQLVRPGEGSEDTRRIALKAELGEQNWDLVRQLADARLVVTSRNGSSQETVEVVHEALIRDWGELRGWMDTDRVFRAWQERLRAAKRQWEETKQDKGSLLRGAALAEAGEQLRKRPEELVAESGFIEQSLRERECLKQVEEKAVHEKKRQQQILIGVMGIGLLLTSGAAMFSLFQVQQVQRQRMTQLATNAQVLLASNDTVGAVISAIAAIGLSQSAFVRFPDHSESVSWGSLIDVVEANRERNQLGQGYKAYVYAVAYSPDGKHIVSSTNNESLRIWDAKTGNQQQTFKMEETNEDDGSSRTVNSAAYSPDGQRIVSSNGEKTVIIRDAKTGAIIGKPLRGHKDQVNSVAYSPNGQYIISGSHDKTVRIWNAETGAPIGKPLQGHKDSVNSVAYSPDSPDEQYIVSGSQDKTVRIWDAKTGASIGKPLQGHKDSVNSVAYSPDGRHIVSGSGDNMLRIWDTKTGAPIGKPFQGHKDSVNSVAYSPDGQRIISGSDDKTVRIWDAKTGAPIGKPLQGHKDSVTSVAHSHDGQHIISGSSDMTVRIWETKIGELIGEPLQGHSGSVNSVAYSLDGQHMISGSDDKTVRIWTIRIGEIISKALRGHTGEVNSVAYSFDNKRIISGSDDKTVRIWDAKTGASIGKLLQGHKDKVNSVAYSPDDRHIISGSDDKTVRIWDAKTGASIGKPLQGSERIVNVAYGNNGQHIIGGSENMKVMTWDAKTGASIGKPLQGKFDPEPYPSSESPGAYSPDGKYILSNSDSGSLDLLDTQTGISQKLSGEERVNSLAYNADTQRIVTGSFYGTLRLWDVTRGVPVSASLPGNSNLEKPHELNMLTNKWLGINSVAFSSDGQRVVSGGSDDAVRLWDVSNKHQDSRHDVLSIACNQLRYHDSLKDTKSEDGSESDDVTKSDVAREAKQTCEQSVWKK